MSKMQQYIEALKEGKGYDWISRHGWDLKKDDLIDIIKEFDFAINSMGICDGKEDLYDAIYEELSERYENH